jgi:7-alpha-hydroxysteroid dehydrogenase
MILAGLNAIVTGAGVGIGRACAIALAEAGANVVASDINLETAEATANAAGEYQRRAIAVQADVGSLADIDRMVMTTLEAFGRIDIVVNNAGGTMPQAFMDTSERAFDEALRWNVTTAFNLTQLAVPHMIAGGGGSIINITSVAGSFSSRGFSAYGTAKGALLKLTRHLSMDLAPKIRVNAISPGSIMTSALDAVLQMPEIERAMIDATPLGRLGTVDDIAAAAVYLASDAGAYVTGRDIRVDGGLENSSLEMPIPDL